MEGSNGGRGSSWSYREEISGSDVKSSRSGTIVSTAYTSSGASRLSTFSMGAAMYFNSLEIHEEEEHDDNVGDYAEDSNTAKARMNHIRSLVQEFSIERSVNCGIKIGGMSVVERWLTELGVGWVLSLNDVASAGEDVEPDHLLRWIWALHEIAHTMCFRRSMFPHIGSMDMPSIGEEKGERPYVRLVEFGLMADIGTVTSISQPSESVERHWPSAEISHQPKSAHNISGLADSDISQNQPCLDLPNGTHVGETCSPTRHHLVLFIQEAMLKMLSFVDVIVALDTFYSYMTKAFPDPVMAPLYNKLIALLDVHDALSEASVEVSQYEPTTSVEVERIENEMTILLSANKSMVGEAIWSKMENIRTKSMGGGEDLSSSLDLQGSSDIHKATQSVVTYIKFLCSSYWSVDAAIRSKYMRDIEHVRPLDSMIQEMVSYLEEKLANISKSFLDHGLGFLFLLNNLYNIHQQLHNSYLHSLNEPVVDLTQKIEGQMERYVEVSWARLLSCLINPIPLCLVKNCSPLSKFESEFHKIYTTQKQWKVPDPELRRRLRKAVSNKIIPAYTEYLEDNKVATPKFTLQELDEMLQEMFEG